MEKQPVLFFVNDLENLIDQARDELSRFVGCRIEDLVFVQNATTGINTVLRSLKFKSGDELLVCDHEYNACRNALEMVAGLTGSKVVVVEIPFPLSSDDEIISRILDKVNSRTRLVMLDHISSQTGLRFPIDILVKIFNERGIETLIDGAHAPGMIPLNISELNPTYYTANCHKWMCSPKGSGFLYVDKSRQADIRPLSISHGANSTRTNRSRYQIEFGWTGTWDPTAYLGVPKAIVTSSHSADEKRDEGTSAYNR
ncbi:MAG TPA: aminotransferase class V-fold PLP-dependent enzyme, partial [Verrucomicrobiales bacterium]|nr:aminotransferase class V-fold PLP-dependent enzyme [Verrucomicrobiales bacterium]